MMQFESDNVTSLTEVMSDMTYAFNALRATGTGGSQMGLKTSFAVELLLFFDESAFVQLSPALRHGAQKVVGAPRQAESRHKFASSHHRNNTQQIRIQSNQKRIGVRYRIWAEQEAQTGMREPGPTAALFNTPRPLLGADWVPDPVPFGGDAEGAPPNPPNPPAGALPASGGG